MLTARKSPTVFISNERYLMRDKTWVILSYFPAFVSEHIEDHFYVKVQWKKKWWKN